MNTKLICLIIAATIALAASASFCLAQDIQYQEAVITLPSGNRFNCEIADSVFKRSVGLKYHKELEPGTDVVRLSLPQPDLLLDASRDDLLHRYDLSGP